MAQGAHRGRPVAAAPCTPGLRPATSPLRGAFDLSLQASGRAEAASLQNTALSPHPCGLPRPSGNVSAILRPPAPAVSARKVNKLTAGRTNVGRVRRSRHPAQTTAWSQSIPHASGPDSLRWFYCDRLDLRNQSNFHFLTNPFYAVLLMSWWQHPHNAH